MISKELLSEVLNINVTDVEYDEKLRCINYGIDGDKDYRRKLENVYELAHKCIEWAFKNKIQVYALNKWKYKETLLGPTEMKYKVVTKTFEESLFDAIGKATIDCFYADTMPEAVFKACEWIMKEKDKKCYLD